MNNLIIRHIFNDAVKQHRYVRRDATGVEYIALRGKKALGNGGLDHIYLINLETVGFWITRGTIKSTIRRLQAKVSGLRVEQLGDGEAVLSAPLNQLDDLCQAAGARIRPRYSEETLTRKRRAARHARAYLPSDREAS
jgi:hypothetical protein